MNKLMLRFNQRLALIYQCDTAESLSKSTFVFAFIGMISLIYFFVAFCIFHSLWYHKLFCLVSTLIFAYSMQELYFEQLEKKIKQSLPKTTKKLSHYYTHYKGNVISAIKEVEEKCPLENRRYLQKIHKALIAGKPESDISTLKSTFPFVWFRMLASVLYIAKEKGMGVDSEAGQANMIGKNLTKMTNILSFINVQQGYNDAELKYVQVFLYIAPFLFIYATDWVNSKILIEMNMLGVYQGIEAQNIKSYIFLSSNISALFIHWMRKQQI